MTKSPGGWAPWISDPDPLEKPMSLRAIKAFAKNVGKLMARKDREGAEAAKQAPAPTPSSAPTPKQSIAELYRSRGCRELPLLWERLHSAGETAR